MTTEIQIEEKSKDTDIGFDVDLIKKYPKSNKKMKIQVAQYSLKLHTTDSLEKDDKKGQTTHISPHGVEFQTPQDLPLGALIKIELAIPHYWKRKKSLVTYSRVDTPNKFAMLAKVVSSTTTRLVATKLCESTQKY